MSKSWGASQFLVILIGAQAKLKNKGIEVVARHKEDPEQFASYVQTSKISGVGSYDLLKTEKLPVHGDGEVTWDCY